MHLEPHLRLEGHSTARNQCVAAQPIFAGSTILTEHALSSVLLLSEKQKRCDACHKLALSNHLKKCTGCASFWYCDTTCQTADWVASHKKICRSFNQLTSSKPFIALENHEKMDSLLLTNLVAHIESMKLSFDDASSPLCTFMSLLPGPSKATHPPVLSKTSIFEGRLNNLYWRFGNNNFSIHSHFNTYAHGIFPLASRLFNHSCTPNAAAKYIITPENSVKMEVIALRPISAGEEICLPYIDPALLQTRRTVFQMTYGFTCHCPSCVLLNTLGDVPEPPKEAEERKKVSKRLRDFMVSNGDANPIVSGVSALDPFPPELRCVLHESFLASLAEDFSNAAHDGPYDVAVEYGTTLTALYQLIYPPNYPQIGLHSLEMAKITWNQIVLSDSHDRAMKQQMWAYLSSAEKVLATLGKEGDQSNGPWNEIEMLTNILIEEGRDKLSSVRTI
ncbi:histone-lysine n-methyltransferase ashr1 [Moniliophthora roreri MCA 2997]|uniref:Histone-lysine n-methyltransferase ashr1 n=1 Tax=Moniliophthora roreri (strain MCA 2997) TaxID=1381753 RepID=V2YFL3_MONRO|nr:histone-lysine n-methyltransferase ashr1 [Moniliophthora roreri MCA 2997]